MIQLVAGISSNGKISDFSGDFSECSSAEDKQFLKKKIEESDVLIMGRKTFEKHVKTSEKPIIVFSKQIKGIELDFLNSSQIHWFNDSKQELMNLCDLLRYKTITILGGSEIYHWSLREKILTDIFLTVEPFIIDTGQNLLTGDSLHQHKSWKLRSAKRMNEKGSLFLHYQL
ncbi:MAG: dihydrofolate reductase [bacterium]|nr:dihydrofolate reductase [bacterium]